MEHADRPGGGTVDLVGLVIEPFDVFYRRELRPVVGLAYVLTGRRSAAEDLAQEAFVAAYRRWRDIGGYDDPGAWVRRVVALAAYSARSRPSLAIPPRRLRSCLRPPRQLPPAPCPPVSARRCRQTRGRPLSQPPRRPSGGRTRSNPLPKGPVRLEAPPWLRHSMPARWLSK
jgi:hypothetical protein